jgi:rod shape-determining protein MreD
MTDTGYAGLQYAKNAGIYAVLVFLFFMNVFDVPFLTATYGRQAFLLAGLYFFLIYRPRLLPYPVIFGFGLMLDFIAGGLVGFNALCFMVLAIILRGQRRFLLGQSWVVVWAGFCVAAGTTIIFQAVIYAMVAMQMPPILPILLNIVISSFVYPLFLPLMIALNR